MIRHFVVSQFFKRKAKKKNLTFTKTLIYESNFFRMQGF